MNQHLSQLTKITGGDVREVCSVRRMNAIQDAILARIAQLRLPQSKRLLLTKDRKREMLYDIAVDTARPAMVRIRAIEVDAKLAGHFEPEPVKVEVGPTTLDEIRERANKVASGLDLIARRAAHAREAATSGNGNNGHANGTGTVANGNGTGNAQVGALSRWHGGPRQ